MTIGQRIKRYLKERGLRQRDLTAKAVKLSEKEISLLVNDKRPIFLESVERINHFARVLGVTPNELIEDACPQDEQDTPYARPAWNLCMRKG